MQHHQLALLREKLHNLVEKHRHCHNFNLKVQLENQIKSVKGNIANLGANGVLKMAVVVKKVWNTNNLDESGTLNVVPITESYMFWDLDDESIYTLLKAYLKNGEEHISKSIIEVPLKKPIPSSLKDNKISWSIL